MVPRSWRLTRTSERDPDQEWEEEVEELVERFSTFLPQPEESPPETKELGCPRPSTTE